MSASILVPFSIARAALDPRTMTGVDPAHYRRLVALWKHVGVLVLKDGEESLRELAQLVKELPQEARKTLCEALVALDQRRLRCCRESHVPAIMKTCPVDVPDGCSRRAYVHAADSLTAQAFRSRLPAGFETAAMDVIDQAEAFVAAVTLSGQPVARRADVDATWSARMAPMLAFARDRVTLVDHYAVSSARRHRERSGTWERTGLWRFLRESAKHKGAVNIEVITPDDSDSPGSTAAALKDCADQIGGRTRRWKVDLVSPVSHRFKGAVHYRCILVDTATCLLLDYGIEAFNGDKLSRTLMTQLVHPDGSVRGDIDELRRSARAVVV